MDGMIFSDYLKMLLKQYNRAVDRCNFREADRVKLLIDAELFEVIEN